MELVRDKNSVYGMLIFALYTFLYSVTVVYLSMNDLTKGIDVDLHMTLYYAGQGLLFVSFLTYGWVSEKIGSTVQKRIFASLMALYLIFLTSFCISTSTIISEVSFIGIHVCLGLLGGISYHKVSLALKGVEGLPWYVAAASSASILVQYVFQIAVHIGDWIRIFLWVAAIGLMVLICRLVSKEEDAAMPEEPREDGQKRHLIFLVAIVFAMAMLLQFYDGYMAKLQYANGFDGLTAYDWPRLFWIPGCFLVAICRMKKERLLTGVLLLSFLTAILFPVLVGDRSSYTFALCLFYVLVGELSGYAHIRFLETAPKTLRPGLWASMGRIIEFGTGILWMGASLLRVSLVLSMGLQLLLFAVMMLALAADTQWTEGSLVQEMPEEAKEPEVSVEEKIASYATEYKLTPRETDVLTLLVTSDEIGDAMASRLGISRRQLQKHIASIYDKTDTHSRAALLMNFYG